MAVSKLRDAIVRAADEGDRRWFFGGGAHRWMATATETDGAYLLFEDNMEQGKTTPLHLHPEADESMYVLDGRILMYLDGEQREVGPGGLVLVPRGMPHAFLVVSETARVLCLLTPGIGQEFYWGASEPFDPDQPGVVDFGRIHASAQANGGIEILGPPPFGSKG
ncbi:quercetin dioxygenase-like cupin family protein [Kribbella voronezhensis]|uniref:Quercetin dioxygenase-like cupin family protein n=1 Tax=Kribbella voronezhensis TaxID=2512212 RepID=A0A4R7TBY2_9ACTN|nr:quercetin 2,3-dioxygenase [Kribbella voronezhensis]TDU88956.1 quercetin dioxygenase-like cupin family protein [Kribbella voronezhensis]